MTTSNSSKLLVAQARQTLGSPQQIKFMKQHGEHRLDKIKSRTENKVYGTNSWCLGLLRGLHASYSKDPEDHERSGWLIPRHSWAIRWPENNYHLVTVQQSLLAPWGVGFED